MRYSFSEFAWEIKEFEFGCEKHCQLELIVLILPQIFKDHEHSRISR